MTDRSGTGDGPSTGSSTGSDSGDGPEVGTVAEEAAKLFGALGEWARTNGTQAGAGAAGLADQVGQAVRDINDHLATGGEECRWCPLCRTVHAFRETSPEVKAHLATAAWSLMQAASGLLATAVPADGEPGGVERIDLDDDWGDGPHDDPAPGGSDGT